MSAHLSGAEPKDQVHKRILYILILRPRTRGIPETTSFVDLCVSVVFGSSGTLQNRSLTCTCEPFYLYQAVLFFCEEQSEQLAVLLEHSPLVAPFNSCSRRLRAYSRSLKAGMPTSRACMRAATNASAKTSRHELGRGQDRLAKCKPLHVCKYQSCCRRVREN